MAEDIVAPPRRNLEPVVYGAITLLVVAVVLLAGFVGVPKYVWWVQSEAQAVRLEMMRIEADARLEAIGKGCVPNNDSTGCITK